MNSERIRFNPKISAAIRGRDFSTFREMLSAEPQQINAFTPFAGGTWLHYAAHEGDIDAVRHLISLGLDINLGDSREGRAPICDACLGGHEEIVRLLLDAGAMLDTSEPVRNPLFSSIIGRSLPIVKMLLDSGIEYGVRYDGPNMKNMDAVAFAVERGENSIAEEIARRQAKGDTGAMSHILEAAKNIAVLNNMDKK